MAEIISGIVQTLMTKVGEKVVHEIKNQLTHLCFHHLHIERLAEEVQKMEIEKDTVQQAVDAALRNLESIRPDVKDWITRVNNWLNTSHKILEKSRHHRNSTSYKNVFLKWLPMVHYSLSVEAQNAINDSVQLQFPPGKFDRVSDRSNPVDLQPVPQPMSETLLRSRALLEKQVIDALEDDVVYLIGLCGMGGVGKTTMATKIHNWAKSSKRFEIVIFTVVSQELDIKEVQKQIADGLGLTLEEHSLHVRAEKIYARLKGAKSFLIILDDVWESLNLAKIGIPSRSTTEKRKLILTSRNQDTLITITKNYKILKVDVLQDEEAWILFREKAGDLIEEPELVETAKQVVEQCKGLPLALVVVGSALRDKNKGMWKDALVQFERFHMPSNIPRVLQDLYIPLKWSYEQLPCEEARYIFLLCCLFPEDDEIPIETLVRYGWGLHIFNEIETVSEARVRVSSLVDILKCRFLLTQAATSKPFFGIGQFVKVHDVLRDMGISIACKDRYVFMVSEGKWPRKTSYENITHIYVELKDKFAFPETLNCPRLEFLHIGTFSDLEGDIPDNFFSSMKCLKVLSANIFSKAILPPSSMSMLTNLQAIYLEECNLGDIELVIRNMMKLEIMSLKDSILEVFPREIGQLEYLKVLDLTGCDIISIESGVISRLVQLEELLMVDCSFWDEEAEEKEKMEVLADIGSLSNLVNLQINLPIPFFLLSLNQPFLPKLERFVFIVTAVEEKENEILYVEDIENCAQYNKVASFSSEKVVPVKNFFLPILRNVECLRIQGDCCIGILNELGKAKFLELKFLHLNRSKNIEYLVPTVVSQSQSNGVLFSALESLYIAKCENLKEICLYPPSIGSFGSLKQLHLTDLNRLQHALPISKFHVCSHLEVLKIMDCPIMKHIFWEENEEEEGVQIATRKNKIKFLRLCKLKLFDIAEMEVFCKGIEEIEFPALQKLVILILPKLTNFVSTEDQFFFSKKILCPNLKILKLCKVKSCGIFNYDIPRGYFNQLEVLDVYRCDNLKNIMASSMSKSLKNLKTLCIERCGELKEVIMPDQDKAPKGQHTNTEQILFPCLQILKLIDLPKMYTFCHMTANLELPSFEVTIEGCPLLKTFSLGSVSCPIIKVFGIKDHALATNIFFHKETSVGEIQIDNKITETPMIRNVELYLTMFHN